MMGTGRQQWSHGSVQCLKHHWPFVMHVANLPPNREVKRVFLWSPTGARKRGAHAMIGQAIWWHTPDEPANPSQDRALWALLMIFQSFVPLVDVLISHCLRHKSCFRTDLGKTLPSELCCKHTHGCRDKAPRTMLSKLLRKQ